jgi:hypothetical protein
MHNSNDRKKKIREGRAWCLAGTKNSQGTFDPSLVCSQGTFDPSPVCRQGTFNPSLVCSQVLFDLLYSEVVDTLIVFS